MARTDGTSSDRPSTTYITASLSPPPERHGILTWLSSFDMVNHLQNARNVIRRPSHRSDQRPHPQIEEPQTYSPSPRPGQRNPSKFSFLNVTRILQEPRNEPIPRCEPHIKPNLLSHLKSSSIYCPSTSKGVRIQPTTSKGAQQA